MRKRFFLKRVVVDHYTVIARDRAEAKQVVAGEPDKYHINKQQVQWDVTGWREEGPAELK